VERRQICIFDAYGTLFDFGSAVARCLEIPVEKHPALVTTWRDKQLQYTWLRTLQDRYVDFERITADALDFALESQKLPTGAVRETLLGLYRKLDPYPETASVLNGIRQAGFATAILSNGTPALLASTVAHAQLTRSFDAVLSADAVQRYKTHRSVYQYALDYFDVPAASVTFVSANGWDAHGAADFGMRSVWCNRLRQPYERLPGAIAHEIHSLKELADCLF